MSMRIIDEQLLNEVQLRVKKSPCQRMNYDLRNSEADHHQRKFNAIEPGSELPIHRHTKTSETMVCLRGKLVVEY